MSSSASSSPSLGVVNPIGVPPVLAAAVVQGAAPMGQPPIQIHVVPDQEVATLVVVTSDGKVFPYRRAINPTQQRELDDAYQALSRGKGADFVFDVTEMIGKNGAGEITTYDESHPQASALRALISAITGYREMKRYPVGYRRSPDALAPIRFPVAFTRTDLKVAIQGLAEPKKAEIKKRYLAAEALQGAIRKALDKQYKLILEVEKPLPQGAAKEQMQKKLAKIRNAQDLNDRIDQMALLFAAAHPVTCDEVSLKEGLANGTNWLERQFGKVNAPRNKEVEKEYLQNALRLRFKDRNSFVKASQHLSAKECQEMLETDYLALADAMAKNRDFDALVDQHFFNDLEDKAPIRATLKDEILRIIARF